MAKIEDPQFLTLEVVAARWGKHPRSVRRMITEGDLAAVRIGGSIRIELAEVQRAETAHPVESVNIGGTE